MFGIGKNLQQKNLQWANSSTCIYIMVFSIQYLIYMYIHIPQLCGFINELLAKNNEK